MATSSNIAIGFSVGAAAGANLARHEAHEAKKTACFALMPTFEDRTATLEARQQYAECVDMIYPRWTPEQEQTFKHIILVLLVSAALGAISSKFSREKDLHWAALAFLWALFFPLVLILVGMVIAGLYWAIS